MEKIKFGLCSAFKTQRWKEACNKLGCDRTLLKKLLSNSPDLLHRALFSYAPTEIVAKLISPQNVNMIDLKIHTPLHWAVGDSRWDVVSLLVQHGANVNLVKYYNGISFYHLQRALSNNAPADVITQLISPHTINMQDLNGETALHVAMQEGRYELVPILLQHGADINLTDLTDRTPLHLLSPRFDSPADIVLQLISPININLKDEDGDTMLHKAVRWYAWDLVPVLLQHGADIRLGNNWDITQLHLAAFYGAPAYIIPQLICLQNINMKDKGGNTALHKAVQMKQWDLVPVLIQHGADPYMLDFPQLIRPLVYSLQAVCIETIRRCMPDKSDEAYNGLKLPNRLVCEAKLLPQANDIVKIGRGEE